jgi:hypothetical protein
MIYISFALLSILFIFLPIVGIIVGYFEGRIIQNDWERDNNGANLINKR